MPKPALSDAIQDYLKGLYHLQTDGDRVSVTALAREQKVSPASASGMVKKLAALGLVEHERPFRDALGLDERVADLCFHACWLRHAANETLRPEDVCLVTADGELLEGPKPSVELPMHLAVLAARPDVGAVVHTHSPNATARPPVAVAEPAPSGTPELGVAVLAAAGDGDAVVIEGHGPVCFGADLAAALERAFDVESSAT